MKIDASSLLNFLAPPKAFEEAREKRLADAAEARVRDAKGALENLSQRRSQASEERKAAARQKIEQLKARLQMLQSMASVDPEGTARLAAQLARELGRAVKDYAAAGGTVSSAPLGQAAAPTENVSGEAQASGAAAAAGTADGQPSAQGGEAKDAGAPGEQGQGQGQGEQGADGREATKSANPYQQAINEAQARVADISRRGAESKADMDFLAEVREMASRIKSLVRQATERLQSDEKALPPEEARELREAVSTMDREISNATADLSGGLVSLLV